MAKYRNLRELAEAFRIGELNFDEWVVLVDNDTCMLNPDLDLDEDDEAERMLQREKEDEAAGLWKGRLWPEDLAVEALQALGIPARRV